MFRVFLFALAIGVTVYAIFDWLLRSKKSTPGNLNRWLWLTVIILVPIAGPLAWIILSLIGFAEQGPSAQPLAPDDDPDYLRQVDERIQRRKRRSRGPEDKPSEPEDL